MSSASRQSFMRRMVASSVSNSPSMEGSSSSSNRSGTRPVVVVELAKTEDDTSLSIAPAATDSELDKRSYLNYIDTLSESALIDFAQSPIRLSILADWIKSALKKQPITLQTQDFIAQLLTTVQRLPVTRAPLEQSRLLKRIKQISEAEGLSSELRTSAALTMKLLRKLEASSTVSSTTAMVSNVSAPSPRSALANSTALKRARRDVKKVSWGDQPVSPREPGAYGGWGLILTKEIPNLNDLREAMTVDFAQLSTTEDPSSPRALADDVAHERKRLEKHRKSVQLEVLKEKAQSKPWRTPRNVVIPTEIVDISTGAMHHEPLFLTLSETKEIPADKVVVAVAPAPPARPSSPIKSSSSTSVKPLSVEYDPEDTYDPGNVWMDPQTRSSTVTIPNKQKKPSRFEPLNALGDNSSTQMSSSASGEPRVQQQPKEQITGGFQQQQQSSSVHYPPQEAQQQSSSHYPQQRYSQQNQDQQWQRRASPATITQQPQPPVQWSPSEGNPAHSNSAWNSPPVPSYEQQQPQGVQQQPPSYGAYDNHPQQPQQVHYDPRQHVPHQPPRFSSYQDSHSQQLQQPPNTYHDPQYHGQPYHHQQHLPSHFNAFNDPQQMPPPSQQYHQPQPQPPVPYQRKKTSRFAPLGQDSIGAVVDPFLGPSPPAAPYQQSHPSYPPSSSYPPHLDSSHPYGAPPPVQAQGQPMMSFGSHEFAPPLHSQHYATPGQSGSAGYPPYHHPPHHYPPPH